MGRGRLLVELSAGILMAVAIHVANAAPVSEFSWGEWTAWTPCSRSCETKLSVQERVCLSDTPCVGPRKQFRSCAAEACSETVDLRAQQCSAKDDATHTYTPLKLEAGEDPCKLTCIASGSNGVTVYGPFNVTLGTSCVTAYGEKGVCLDDMCTPIACDNILGSQKRTDHCMRCIGPQEDDQVCMRNAASVLIEELKYGHVQMLTLPAGASSITVTNQVQPVDASLMLRTPSGEFLFTVGKPGSTVTAAGTEFTYNVEASGDNYTESITASGPLTEEVIVEVYISNFSTPNVSYISYEYYTLVNRGAQGGGDSRLVSIPSNISWVYGEFLECSNSCITGTQTAYAECRDVGYNNRLLPDVYCPSPKPLPILRQCGFEDCAPRWTTSEWQQCSQTDCGIGSQFRVVTCRILGGDGVDRMVEDERCDPAEKPAEERDCVVRETSGCPVQWEVEEWGQCCTSAPLDRSIVCQSDDGTPVAPFLCSHLPRENSTMLCDKGPCENGGCDWVPKRWFKCKVRCGKGIQRRIVSCRNANNNSAGDNCCKGKPVPLTEQECYDDRAERCMPMWHTGSWGRCSGECGEGVGVRTRTVECRAESQERYVTFPDEFCVNQTRPAANQSCTRVDPMCVPCQWETGLWSECNCLAVPGSRTRTVNCSNGFDDCCFERDPNKPVDGESCDCSSTYVPPSPTPMATPSCVDDQLANCQQVLQDGLCTTDSTTVYMQLCCHTCSSNR